MLAEPLAMVALRNRVTQQFEAELGEAVRGCAMVTSRTRCTVRAEVSVDGQIISTSDVSLVSCRSAAAPEEHERLVDCFRRHAAGQLGDAPSDDLPAAARVYAGELDLYFDWDCHDC